MYNVEKAFYSITSSDELRDWMQKPFTIDNYVYATDAHIIAKIPIDKIGAHDELEEKRKKDVIDVFKYEPKKLISIELTELKNAIKSIPLVDEYRNTDLSGNCNECDGEGEVEWEFGYHTKMDDCPVCDGEGVIKKEKREKTGNKVVDESQYIEILCCRFKFDKIQKLTRFIELMGVKKIDVVSQVDASRVTFFKIGITEVGLMPVYKNEDDKVAYSFTGNELKKALAKNV